MYAYLKSTLPIEMLRDDLPGTERHSTLKRVRIGTERHSTLKRVRIGTERHRNMQVSD